MGMTAPSSRPRITAVLGPTNTGKTYFAIERMLTHRSGIIGFPLRLLARENYDRVVAIKGARRVALITGEERIIPKNPAYFLCTVESMPIDHTADFLAVDEIQLAADRDRGHVFTDRLLHARGRAETMFLGSEVARTLVRRLVPEAEYLSRPRFSNLEHTGTRRLTRLPPRSAAVVFSAAGVYGLAEVMRRRQGGVAVVLGALSPRTRNAQVGMYQAGEVDYLVATDAIGMGLNMDINHVAFASLTKFDGRTPRALTAHEVGQIAGRAGRYLSNGSFGTSNGVGTLEAETVAAVESHEYEPLRWLYWRNSDLAFDSLASLRRALDGPPPDRHLVRAPEADDQRFLNALAEHPEVARRAANRNAVSLLWQVCQVPDFRKIFSDSHVRFLAQLFIHLVDDGRLPADWVARQVAAIDRTDGDIETLTQRISFIRTWTYISHRADWIDDARHWQESSRKIEDTLSDALHDRLTDRFVDRRAAALARGLAGGGRLSATVLGNDEVHVEGEFIGRLDGFRFVPDNAAAGEDARAIRSAALTALRGAMPSRVAGCVAAPDEAFDLDDGGRLSWHGGPIARLRQGSHVLAPRIDILASDLLGADDRTSLHRRLTAWFERRLAGEMGPLLKLREASSSALGGLRRGLAFQLAEACGVVPRRRVATLLPDLDRADRKALGALGVRFGAESIFLKAMTRERGRELRRLLWAVHHGADAGAIVAPTLSIARDAAIDDGACLAQGFVPAGPRAVRADALERLSAEARRLAKQGPFLATPALAKTIGAAVEDVPLVLAEIGLRVNGEDGTIAPRPTPKRKRRRRKPADPDSPFAKLKEFKLAK